MKKSYGPTAKKLKRARKDGDIAKSGELTALVTIGYGLLIAALALVFSQQLLINPHNLFSKTEEIEIHFRSISLMIFILCVLIFSLFFVSVVIEMVQVGFSFNLGLVKLNVSRLNPFSGFKKILGIPEEESPWSFFQSPIYEALKSILYWVTALLCLYFLRREVSAGALNSEPSLQSLIQLSFISVGPVGCIFLSLSLVALWVARRLQRLRLSMDREELKRELRDSEGREEQKQFRHEAYLELNNRAELGLVRKAKFIVKRD